jgi:hypothetical protein
MDAPPQQDTEQTKHRVEIINQPNIDAILEDRGQVTVGRVGVEFVAAAGSSYDSLARRLPKVIIYVYLLGLIEWPIMLAIMGKRL